MDEVVARAAGDLEDDDDDLEGNREGEGERGGRKDENENKGGKNNSSSIVQALASGVEVAPSRDGKVRQHSFLIWSEQKRPQPFLQAQRGGLGTKF